MKKLWLFSLTVLTVFLSYAAPGRSDLSKQRGIGGLRGTRQLVLICKDTKTGRDFNITAPGVGITDKLKQQQSCENSGGSFVGISVASAKYAPVFWQKLW